MRLINLRNHQIIARELFSAHSFWKRSVGLLGRKSMAEGSGLWINPCRGIHTCFMKFPIDAIFVDDELRVRSVRRNLRPWRMVPYVWRAASVIELPAGTVLPGSVQKGDQLHVAD